MSSETNSSRGNAFPGWEFFEKAPLGIVVLTKQGNIAWYNALFRELMKEASPKQRGLPPFSDWPDFLEHLGKAKTFHYPIGEQGFIFTPQPLGGSPEQILLWVIPSISPELDWVRMQRDIIQQRSLANLGRSIVEMAHEMSNPLTSISMAAQLMGLSLKQMRELTVSQGVDPEQIALLLDKMEAALGKINHSTGRASSLRHEVLAYSRPNKLDLRPYQMNKLLQSCLSDFESMPIFKHMIIHQSLLPESPPILCDPFKMEQIFYNLLKNAHEATDGKGTVWVREEATEDQVDVEVEDNGPGVPEELLSKIFSPFLTTNPRTGNGLGLSICHQIIEQHGGSFSVYNKPMSGACFRITLPRLKPSMA